MRYVKWDKLFRGIIDMDHCAPKVLLDRSVVGFDLRTSRVPHRSKVVDLKNRNLRKKKHE